MRKEEFYFDSRDGESKIYAVRYIPDTPEVVGVVQIVHGAAEHMGRYEEFARFLTGKGLVVVGEDHLGHGRTAKKDKDPGYFCEQDPATVMIRDVHRLKKMTQQAYPAVPYLLFGHGMGSFIVRNYMCRYGKGISGVVISGTGMYKKGKLNLARCLTAIQKKLKGSGYVSPLVNARVFDKNNKAFEPVHTKADWLTKDADRAEQYLHDSLCGFPFTLNAFETLFELHYRLYDTEALARIPMDLPVLMISGERDPVGEFGEGVRRAYASLQAAGLNNIELKLYENDRHELLNETDRNKVQEDIYGWMQENVHFS